MARGHRLHYIGLPAVALIPLLSDQLTAGFFLVPVADTVVGAVGVGAVADVVNIAYASLLLLLLLMCCYS